MPAPDGSAPRVRVYKGEIAMRIGIVWLSTQSFLAKPCRAAEVSGIERTL
jgi:hypothetical protein